MMDEIIKRTNLVDIGFQCIRNEAPLIRGWARIMLYFCKRVCAIVDPETSDDTVKILKEEFPEVEIFWQDISLGDSTEDHIGEKQHLRTHSNIEPFVKKHVKEGEWMFYFSADERFHPDDFPQIEEELKYLIKQDIYSSGLIHREMYDFVLDENYSIYFDPGLITHPTFTKKPKEWIRRPQTHGGKTNPEIILESKAPFYHYSHILPHKPAFSWSYIIAKTCSIRKLEKMFDGNFPIIRCYKKIDDWLEMSCLLKKNFKEPKLEPIIINVLKRMKNKTQYKFDHSKIVKFINFKELLGNES